MAIKDKLLFQVELVPPNTGNVKKVSQVLDQATKSQRQFNDAQERGSKDTSQIENRLEQYDKKLRKLNQSIRETEEGARFYGTSTEEATKSLSRQEQEAISLRKQIKQLDSQVENSNVSWKKHARLVNRANSVVKKTNLAQDKVQTGFRSMSRSGAQANQTLMDFGRIVQDAPFGIIGISNNIDPLAQSFRRLKSSTGGAGSAISAMMSKMVGTGGLIFLVGSLLPTALVMAQQGMIGFGDETEEAGTKTVELNDNLKTVIDSMTELRQMEGDDPLGIRESEARLSSIRTMLNTVDDLEAKIQERRVKQAKSTGEIASNVTAGASGLLALKQASSQVSKQNEHQLDQLEEKKKKILENIGLNEEDIDKLQEKETSIENTISLLEKRSKIDPAQAFNLRNLNEYQEGLENVKLGLGELVPATEGIPRAVDSATRNLRRSRDELEKNVNELQRYLETNERDTKEWRTKKAQFLRGKEILEKYNDTLDTNLDGANKFLNTYEKGIVPSIVEGNQEIDTTIEGMRMMKSSLKDQVSDLQEWVKNNSKDNVAWERKNEKLEKARKKLGEYSDTLDDITPPTIEPEYKVGEDDIIPAEIMGEELKFDIEFPNAEQAVDDLTGRIMDKEKLEKLKEDRQKFQADLRNQTFEMRKESASELISLKMNTNQRLRDLNRRARELDLQGTKRVARMKEAIHREHAKKRAEIIQQNKQDIAQGYMGVAEHVATFMGSLNNALAEESKGIAIAQLAIQKGLKIAEVVTEASSKVFKLNALATQLEAQAGAKTAQAIANPAMSLVHGSQASALFGAAENARAQAGKVSTMAGVTSALIAGTGIAEASSILSADSGGGSSGGGGGASAPSMSQGFRTDEREDEDENTRRSRSNIADRGRERNVDGDTIIYLQGDMSDSQLFKRVQAGKKRASQDSVIVRSD